MCGLNIEDRYIDFDELFDELLLLKPFSNQEATRTFFLASILTFIHHVANKNIQLCKVEFFTLLELIEQHQDKLQEKWLVQLFYHLSIYHFLAEEYEECLAWVNKTQSFPLCPANQYLFNYSKLIGALSKNMS